MSTNKLDQSLDAIVGERRGQMSRRGRPVRRSRGGARAAAAPVGGVHKNMRSAKVAEKVAVPTGPSRPGEGKIIVSNLVSFPKVE